MAAIPEPSKCCFCAPLRPGLLAWAYIRLIVAVAYFVLTFYLTWKVQMTRSYEYDPYSQRQTDYQSIIQFIAYVSLFMLNFLFSVIFVIGVHHEYYKLLVAFFVFTMLEVPVTAAALGWTVYREVVSDHEGGFPPNTLDYWAMRPGILIAIIVPFVFNILLPFYFMIVIRSELYKIKAERNKPVVFRGVVSAQPVTKRPRKQSLGGVLRREGNWKCFMLTLMIAGCLGSVAWCNTAKIDKELIDLHTFPIKRTVRESPCDVGYAYIPIAFVLLLYLVYLVECYHSTARIQLARRVDTAAVSARVHAMRTATPRVWWKAICYHYVRRKRQVTRYRNGDAYTTTQVYYERVNTHSASTSFAHACCGQRDASRNLVLDSSTPITKVRFSKGFAFANIEAASEFEDQRSRFFAEHERFDDFMEMREGLDLIGVSSFKEYMVAYRDADNCPWYSSQWLFWTLSCLLLSWPLRIVIECNTAYVHYTITKIFGTNYELDPSRQLDIDTHMSDTLPPVPHRNYGWAIADEQSALLCSAPRAPRALPLSHASTVDSLELFAAIRENCALVPSYSEAMRIDAALREDPAENAEGNVAIDMEAEPRPNRPAIKAASFDEPAHRPRAAVASTHSTHNISALTRSHEAKQLNRRSWAGMISTNRTARQILEEIRSAAPVCYQPMPEAPGRRSGESTLYFSRELSPTCSRDPFGGRAQTTPTDEPPSYEEALKLPAVRKLTRSITGTDLAGPRRAFLRDVLSNRRSCLEGVGVLAGAKSVRLPYSDPGDETPL